MVIGGKGSEQERLAAMIRERRLEGVVRMAGFIPEEELADYYSAADLFVLPSMEVEGFGLPVLEALAYGLRPVVSPVGGQVEIVRPLSPDLILPDLTSQGMARHLSGVLKNIDSLPDAEGCARYARRYSWWKFTTDHLQLINATYHID